MFYMMWSQSLLAKVVLFVDTEEEWSDVECGCHGASALPTGWSVLFVEDSNCEGVYVVIKLSFP